ncbi:MAG: DivIVA domain-containing protein [Bdellovibrionaceae bacterium]|nr:DivIVA domain-containing protein [Pseudobdellovibrionaceae bacterium]
MEFSKDNIVSKHFSKKAFGGLNEFEVRDFLHVLAEQIRHLNQENISLKKDLKEKENLVSDYRDREHILKESITNAEKWAEKIKQEAENQSQLVMEKAESKSESLIQTARHSLQTVYNDIADLKRIQLQFKTGLKAALQVQLELLEQDSPFNPDLSIATQQTNSISNQDLQNEKKENEEPQDALPTAIDDKELTSLKESLQSLNKSF